MRDAHDAVRLARADPFGHLFEQKIGFGAATAVIDQKNRRANLRAPPLLALGHLFATRRAARSWRSLRALPPQALARGSSERRTASIAGAYATTQVAAFGLASGSSPGLTGLPGLR